MNDNEIIDLLSVITAYDNRTTGDGELLAWSDAASRGRWTFDEASEAVKAHYAESTAWIMPGHVTHRVREARTEPPHSRKLPQATPESAESEHRRQVVKWFAQRMDANRRPSHADRKNAMHIPCPYCGVRAERACWQTDAHGSPLASGKTMEDPHRQRVNAGREDTDDD